MTCSCESHPIPEANQEVMANVGLRVVGPLTIALAELAELTRKPRPVWVRAADRFATGYLSAVPTDKPTAIAAKQLDRQGIVITNLSDTAADTVWVGSTIEIAQRLGHPAYPIRGGKSLTIPTTSAVYVFAAAGSAPEIAWVATELDLP